MAKLANYGDLPSGFTRFLAFGEDKDRFEVPVQRKRSLEALARFGGKALDDASLPVHRQLRQLLVREVFAKYPISDEFAYMPEYNSLYTEITGFVQLKLEEDGKL